MLSRGAQECTEAPIALKLSKRFTEEYVTRFVFQFRRCWIRRRVSGKDPPPRFLSTKLLPGVFDAADLAQERNLHLAGVFHLIFDAAGDVAGDLG